METTAARRIQRVRHELKRRDVAVARVEHLSPGFTAVTFAGRALPTAASLDLEWVDTPEALVRSVQALQLPEGEGYA
ncbi:hypothetical protein [Ramlibacter humi]|uniref:hypothetical protein n=1 Tax=Ramlibacter humi TaxID=2530451 RepID=UPI001EEFBF58|nr:hypothetical protein [Ramlibacter humi]